jgi:hypothetical protein
MFQALALVGCSAVYVVWEERVATTWLPAHSRKKTESTALILL